MKWRQGISRVAGLLAVCGRMLASASAQQVENPIRPDQVIVLLNDVAAKDVLVAGGMSLAVTQDARREGHAGLQSALEASDARAAVREAIEKIRGNSFVPQADGRPVILQSDESIPAAADATGTSLTAVDVPTAEAMVVLGDPRDVASFSESLAGNASVTIVPSRERRLPELQARPVAAATSWAMDRINAAAARAQHKVDGTGVKVAIIDSGLTVSPLFNAGNVVHKASNNLSFVPGLPNDDSAGHGTHVAGLIGGLNGIGGAPGATLIPIKVFHNNRAPDAAIVLAIDKAVREGADIVNMSFGAPWNFDAPLPNDDNSRRVYQTQIRKLREARIRVIAAAGNHSAQNSFSGEVFTGDVLIPGLLNEVICVAATDRNDQPAVFTRPTSKFAHEARDPDIAAPGVSVVSAAPSGALVEMSGTSMATPVVSGIVALMCQQQPGISQEDILKALQSSGPAPASGDVWRIGAGRIDALAALGTSARPTPGEPGTGCPPASKGTTPEQHTEQIATLTGLRDFWKSKNTERLMKKKPPTESAPPAPVDPPAEQPLPGGLDDDLAKPVAPALAVEPLPEPGSAPVADAEQKKTAIATEQAATEPEVENKADVPLSGVPPAPVDPPTPVDPPSP
jgi:subtilisin family serine protease